MLGILAGSVWSGLSWLRIGTGSGLLWIRWSTFRFWRHGISYLVNVNTVLLSTLILPKVLFGLSN
jgi:hypothetical protein